MTPTACADVTSRAQRSKGWALLMWLPLVAAILIVLMTPTQPVHWLHDSTIYVQQAQAIRSGDAPSGRYPPGLPVLLAAGDFAGVGVSQVIQFVAVALVVLVVVTARRLGGPVAGAVAGLLCCSSPWLIASGGFVMSDPLAAALATAALLAVLNGRPAWAAVATIVGVLVRLFSGVGIIALFAVSRRLAVVAAVSAAVLFGGFQWAASGSPFSTGYDNGGASWAPAYIVDGDRTGDGNWLVDGGAAKASTPDSSTRDWPNLIAYPLVVLGVTFVFMPPFLAVAGLWALWVRRGTAAALFVGWWLAGSLAMALPYFFQSPRFLAPAMMMVLVYAAVGIVDLFRLHLDQLEPPPQPAAEASPGIVVTCAGSVSGV